MSFQDTWNFLQHNLSIGTKINYWSTNKGWTQSGYFTITAISPNEIEIQINSNKTRKIPMSDFQTIYNHWNSLWNHTIQRQNIRQLTYHASYIISIYFWMHGQCGSKLP